MASVSMTSNVETADLYLLLLQCTGVAIDVNYDCIKDLNNYKNYRYPLSVLTPALLGGTNCNRSHFLNELKARSIM